jgi:hypothetical protein
MGKMVLDTELERGKKVKKREKIKMECSLNERDKSSKTDGIVHCGMSTLDGRCMACRKTCSRCVLYCAVAHHWLGRNCARVRSCTCAHACIYYV